MIRLTMVETDDIYTENIQIPLNIYIKSNPSTFGAGKTLGALHGYKPYKIFGVRLIQVILLFFIKIQYIILNINIHQIMITFLE